ncbi:MAG TPA: hypothetical protein VFQ15_01845, partial [Jiangellaceae bacterium]|nr:hypothetical protein [Jiangellaceae bacterium]
MTSRSSDISFLFHLEFAGHDGSRERDLAGPHPGETDLAGGSRARRLEGAADHERVAPGRSSLS